MTINRIIMEPVNAFDDLRIIASSGTRLDTPTREIIRSAADELEGMQKALVVAQFELIEAQARLIAVNEQLIEARRSQPWNLRWEYKS